MGVPCLLSHFYGKLIGSGSILKRSGDCRFAVLLDWDGKNLPILGLPSDKALDRVVRPKNERESLFFAKDFEIITVKEKDFGSWIVLFINDEHTIGEATACEVIGPNETLRLFSVEGDTGDVTITPRNETEWIVQDSSVLYKSGGGTRGKVVGRFDNVDDAAELHDSMLKDGHLLRQLHLMEVPKGHYTS